MPYFRLQPSLSLTLLHHSTQTQRSGHTDSQLGTAGPLRATTQYLTSCELSEFNTCKLCRFSTVSACILHQGSSMGNMERWHRLEKDPMVLAGSYHTPLLLFWMLAPLSHTYNWLEVVKNVFDCPTPRRHKRSGKIRSFRWTVPSFHHTSTLRFTYLVVAIPPVHENCFLLYTTLYFWEPELSIIQYFWTFTSINHECDQDRLG